MTEITLPDKLKDVELVRSVRTPASMEYTYTAGQATTRFLKGIAEGKILGERVVLGRRHEHPPVGRLDAQQHLLAQAGEEGPDHRSGGSGERIFDDEGRAEHPRVVGHGLFSLSG